MAEFIEQQECPACGRNDRFGSSGTTRHFTGGQICKGVPVTVRYEKGDGYKRGFADGLEAAANTAEALEDDGDSHTRCDYDTVERILREQAAKVREVK